MAYYEGAAPFTEHAAVLLGQRHGDRRISGRGQQLYECADYTAAYGRIEDKVHSTFPLCEIDRICLVNAPQMYGMYLLRKEEMETQCSGRPYATEVQELELFHVTAESKGNESLRSGLDWRRTTRSKYGRGVSFSDDADYADYYANNASTEGYKRVIIVCTVLVAKTWRVNNKNKNKRLPNNELIVPPGTCDTTVSPNGRVYVKYYDYEFYPLYMVYYRRRPEHVPLSRYHNIGNNNSNKKKGAVVHQQQEQQQQQWYASAESETRQREQQEERERRQREEKLRWHQEMAQKQQDRRLQEQKRQWQSQQAERVRREQFALSEQQRRRRQQEQAHARNKESCSIL